MLTRDFNFRPPNSRVKICLMLNAEITSSKHLFPTGFRREFDAHVYYTPETRAQAKELQLRAKAHFVGRPILVGDLVDLLVGPHPQPMFEINFARKHFVEVVFWLMQNRGSSDVLVHEVTGDDPKDHSSGALWLGHSLVLDESKLDSGPGA